MVSSLSTLETNKNKIHHLSSMTRDPSSTVNNWRSSTKQQIALSLEFCRGFAIKMPLIVLPSLDLVTQRLNKSPLIEIKKYYRNILSMNCLYSRKTFIQSIVLFNLLTTLSYYFSSNRNLWTHDSWQKFQFNVVIIFASCFNPFLYWRSIKIDGTRNITTCLFSISWFFAMNVRWSVAVGCLRCP